MVAGTKSDIPQEWNSLVLNVANYCYFNPMNLKIGRINFVAKNVMADGQVKTDGQKIIRAGKVVAVKLMGMCRYVSSRATLIIRCRQKNSGGMS